MKTQNTLHLAGLLLLLLSCAALLGPAASTEAQEVHALIIILGDDMNIRASVEKSESHLKELMGRVSEHCPVRLTVLKSEDEITGSVTKMSLVAGEARGIDKKDSGLITGKHVSDWLNGLHPAAEDTVLIYYNGHGELRDFDDAHVLKFAGSEVPRDLLRTELEKKPGRLKMLITDTCSKKADNTGEELVAQHLARIQGKGQRYTRNLFLEHTGILDMTAASPGELAWGNNKVGGYFTASLIKSFRGTSDKNSDDFLEWREVFPVCVSETETLYKDTEFTLIQKNLLNREGQTTQQPVAHSLPTRLASSNYGQPAIVEIEQFEVEIEQFDEAKEQLWDISSPNADFTVAWQAERTAYEVEESITFDITLTADAHIVMLIWGPSGGPALLFPNDYSRDTLWRVGKHSFPGPDADFEIQFLGPPSTERFKVLAFQNEADANAVINLLQPEEASDNQVGSVLEILRFLLDMNPADWAEAQLEIPVREPERPGR